ncbi:MAG TPA: GlsB/YeaQ/YmgE family stress response membrane protein [Ktedonobacterales bacterium]
MVAAALAVGLHALGNIALDPGSVLAWIIAGFLAGWLAGLVVRGRGFGCLGNILLGLVGAFVGEFLLSLLPITIASGVSGFVETLIVAFLGALVLVALGRLIGGSRRPRYPAPPPRGPYTQP